MKTPRTGMDALRVVQRELRDAGIADWRQAGEWLCMDVLSCTRIQLLANAERGVSELEWGRLRSLILRRISGEPVQYILGHTEFMGLRLNLTSDVLIPRPETECLVETAVAVAEKRDPRVLDIGTGSGCIALAIKHALPRATVFACDVSESAIAVAKQNAMRLNLDIRFEFCDLREPCFGDRWDEPFDLIVSNPPYVATGERVEMAREVVDYEPHIALFAPGDPLIYYRAIAASAQSLLTKGGWVAVEVHEEHAGHVSDLFTAMRAMDNVKIKKDLAGKDRIVLAYVNANRSG